MKIYPGLANFVPAPYKSGQQLKRPSSPSFASPISWTQPTCEPVDESTPVQTVSQFSESPNVRDFVPGSCEQIKMLKHVQAKKSEIMDELAVGTSQSAIVEENEALKKENQELRDQIAAFKIGEIKRAQTLDFALNSHGKGQLLDELH